MAGPVVTDGALAACGGSGAEARLEPVELGPEDGRAGRRRTSRTTPGSAGSRPSTPRRRRRAPAASSSSVRSRPSMSSAPGAGTWPIGVSTAAACALDALDDPLQDPAVLAEARPQEAAVLVAAEPVDVEDLRQLGGVVVLADRDPVVEVVAGVVADERQHRHRVAAHDADLADRGGGGLRGERRAQERAVGPVAGLGDQRDRSSCGGRRRGSRRSGRRAGRRTPARGSAHCLIGVQ